MLTLYLGDRKSETYALQWKYIDFENQTVRLKYALDKHKRNLQKVERYYYPSSGNCNDTIARMEISAS